MTSQNEPSPAAPSSSPAAVVPGWMQPNKTKLRKLQVLLPSSLARWICPAATDTRVDCAHLCLAVSTAPVLMLSMMYHYHVTDANFYFYFLAATCYRLRYSSIAEKNHRSTRNQESSHRCTFPVSHGHGNSLRHETRKILPGLQTRHSNFLSCLHHSSSGNDFSGWCAGICQDQYELPAEEGGNFYRAIEGKGR